MTSPADTGPTQPLAPLILVVGPSGAGKDTLIEGARRALAGDGSLSFARRVVTRDAQAGAEDHDVLSPEDFAEAERTGAFLLSWRAHGLGYGIPAGVQAQRRAGVAVVANVSRTVVADARRRQAPVRVVVVTAPPELLAARLAGRGRESAADILARLRRAEEFLPAGPDVLTVVNDASPEDGIRAFVAAIDRIKSGPEGPYGTVARRRVAQ